MRSDVGAHRSPLSYTKDGGVNPNHSWRARKQIEREQKLQQAMNQTEKARWQEESERQDPAFMAEVDLGVDALLDYIHDKERKGEIDG
jgi:hypothetical protein